ncbi:MAG: ACT domain-containing protein [Anaerolineae bacterium]
MPSDAEKILAQAAFSLHPDEFLLIRLPPAAVVAAAAVVAELADPFMALIVDSRELTVILERESFDEYAHRLPSAEVADTSFRLLTLEQPLNSDLVGLMAIMARVLADAGISLLALSAYAYDHLFVPAQQAEAALSALEEFQASLRSSQ